MTIAPHSQLAKVRKEWNQQASRSLLVSIDRPSTTTEDKKSQSCWYGRRRRILFFSVEKQRQ
jgi:hypothetical protein